MAVPKRTRFEVLRRDGHKCHYCGAAAPDVPLTVDHVLPVALGGSDDPSNLVSACRDCNSGKGSTAPDSELVAALDAKAEQWKAARARVVADREATIERIVGEGLYRLINEWAEWDEKREFMPPDWPDQLLQLHEKGLEPYEIVQCYRIAVNASIPHGRVWRYMLGVARNKLNERDAAARTLIERGEI